MKIPLRLQDERIRFCKIRKGTKKPFETDWPNKQYTWKEIQEWLDKEDGNYGILCGPGDLAIIDADKPELQYAVDAMFPKTYMIKTPGGGTHNYYFIPGLKQKMIIEPDGNHLGEVQSTGTQCVGPGSIHPNGGMYSEMNQNQIATVNFEDLIKVLKPFMKEEITETEETAKSEKSFSENSKIDDLSVTDIWGTSGLHKSDDEWYGAHPIHGSSGGMNFWINPQKNIWHCFRCNSGGGPLSAIAVKEGIIDCSEARRGNLRGNKAVDALQKARSKYGLQDQLRDKDGFFTGPVTNYKPEPIKVIWAGELQNYEIGTQRWILDKLIPTKSISVISGKRGTMKSFVALMIACCVSSGKNFLDQYQCEKGTVIYLDKENGTFIMKERMDMIKRGMDWVGDPDIDKGLGFICFSSLRIDRPSDIQQIKELIKEKKPILLVIDTYRRSIGFDENDAGEVSKLFVETLRPLVDELDFSVLFIHHHRKSSPGQKTNKGGDDEGESSIDEMDEMRGSSDFANYADSIIKIERKMNADFLVIKQLKNRNAPEEKPIKVGLEFVQNSPMSLKMWYGGGFITKTIMERAQDSISNWIIMNKLKTFKTSEAEAYLKKEGFKESNIKNALSSLVDMGKLNRATKGHYDVMF